MAGISHVFTISRVAEMLGEDEDLLLESVSRWIRKTDVSPFSAPVTSQ